MRSLLSPGCNYKGVTEAAAGNAHRTALCKLLQYASEATLLLSSLILELSRSLPAKCSADAAIAMYAIQVYATLVAYSYCPFFQLNAC